MFAYWSGTETSHRDLAQYMDMCPNCQSKQLHTYRMNMRQTKYYSVIPGSTKKSIMIICHNCLFESVFTDKKHEKQLIEQFNIELKWKESINEGMALLSQQRWQLSERYFREQLNIPPIMIPTLENTSSHVYYHVFIAGCLIKQKKQIESKEYIDFMKSEYANNEKEAIKEQLQLLTDEFDTAFLNLLNDSKSVNNEETVDKLNSGFCTECGNEISNNHKFCMKCGTKI